MSAPVPSLAAKARPYRRFLTSAFHSRFVHASSATLVVAADNVFWIADKRNIWSWFPLGPALPKIFLLFFTSLFIFILHVATLTIGSSTAISPFATIRSRIQSLSTIQTVFWYLISAWWFSETYIWSCAPSAGLSWVVKGGMSSPDRLNERPIYLRAILFSLALVQSCRHVYFDKSCLRLPITMPPTPAAKDQRTHPFDPMSRKMQTMAVPTVAMCTAVSGAVAVLGPFYYTLFLRQTFWWLHLQMAKPFFNLSRSSARPTGYPPSNPLLMARSFGVAYLLMLTWEATSFLFSSYLLQEPLKKGEPLSARSRDPNGTLVNGLKARRDVVKTFAFWELALIAQRLPERRKMIFADIERSEGARWTQMLRSGLAVIEGITIRLASQTSNISTAAQPSAIPPATSALPRIAPEIHHQQILLNPPSPSSTRGEVKALVGNSIRRVGQSEHPWTPPIYKVSAMLERVLGSTQSAGLLQVWWTSVKSSPIGWLFTTTPDRKVNALVFGSPYGNAALVVDVIEGITKMLVASLAEDLYGKAIAGVPETVRVFSKAIHGIESLLAQQSVDIDQAELYEVNVVLARLKAGLAELLSAFQLYLSDVGLGIAELNEAKKAVEKRSSQINRSDSVIPGNREEPRERQTERRGLFDRPRQKEKEKAEARKQVENQPRPAETTRPHANKYLQDGQGRDQHLPELRQRREMEMVR